MYLAIVHRILGNGHPFAEDVVSECMIKANSLIEKGNEITPQYFSAMVLNASLDYIKKRDNRLTCRIPDNYEVEDDSENYVNFDFSICDVEEYLRQYEVKSVHNKFRADVFRLHFLDGRSLLSLQRDTEIDRKYLALQKRIITNKVKQWLNHNIELKENK